MESNWGKIADTGATNNEAVVCRKVHTVKSLQIFNSIKGMSVRRRNRSGFTVLL